MKALLMRNAEYLLCEVESFGRDPEYYKGELVMVKPKDFQKLNIAPYRDLDFLNELDLEILGYPYAGSGWYYALTPEQEAAILARSAENDRADHIKSLEGTIEWAERVINGFERQGHKPETRAEATKIAHEWQSRNQSCYFPTIYSRPDYERAQERLAECRAELAEMGV